MRIETRYDHRRGCGWRKPGGKYLVSGGLVRECGKLPHRLDRCPVCDHGIKPTRGWTWIGAKALFGVGPCDAEKVGPEGFCRGCFLQDPPERAGLIWIGGQFYATPEAFTREAAQLGISRRIAQIPKGLVVGKTLVLLAHREVEFTWGEDPAPGIFAAFIPHAIEYVVTGQEEPDELERIEKQGCTLVRVIRCEGLDDGGAGDSCAQPGSERTADVRPHGSRLQNGLPAGGGADGGPVQQVSATAVDREGQSIAGP